MYFEYEIRDTSNNKFVDIVCVSKNSNNEYMLFEQNVLENGKHPPKQQVKNTDKSQIAIYKNKIKNIPKK